MKSAGKFCPINRAEFCVAQWQVAIRSLSGFVDSDMKRAVHRLDPKLLLLKLHRRKHRVRIVLFVSADKPQVTLGYMRGVDESISASEKLLTNIVLHFLANRATFRVPEN